MQNHAALYNAFMAKDTRLDGRFYVGISSTGIYCRPVCRAKRPKAQNCTFFTSAAAAEQAGYRPCLLCRPELAPGAAPADACQSLARRAAALLGASCGNGQTIEETAAHLGCTSRHLRRVFTAEYGVPPVQYLQTCRLLLAKSLLTDTSLPVLDAAMAAGFGSLRRFNGLFKAHYGLSPTALRRCGATGKARGQTITLPLGYRPPYRWQALLSFLATRAIPGVEQVQNGAYQRTVQLQTGDGPPLGGWIQAENLPAKNALALTLSESLLPALPLLLARVRHLFDLDCDPHTIYDALQGMNEIEPGLCKPGTRLPGCFNSFEMAVRAVLGQQISVGAARTLAARLAAAFGEEIENGVEGLTHLFPTPETLLALPGPLENHLGPLGITTARAKAIGALAGALATGALALDATADPIAEQQALCQIPGIGPWTASYIAMRAMQWPDAFLETDAAIKKALAPRTGKELLALAEGWRPWRSYATVNLWQGL